MQTSQNNNKDNSAEQNKIDHESRKKQQQTDPQITELKGFFDKNEKIEPDLEDGKESTNDEKK